MIVFSVFMSCLCRHEGVQPSGAVKRTGEYDVKVYSMNSTVSTVTITVLSSSWAPHNTFLLPLTLFHTCFFLPLPPSLLSSLSPSLLPSFPPSFPFSHHPSLIISLLVDIYLCLSLSPFPSLFWLYRSLRWSKAISFPMPQSCLRSFWSS